MMTSGSASEVDVFWNNFDVERPRCLQERPSDPDREILTWVGSGNDVERTRRGYGIDAGKKRISRRRKNSGSFQKCLLQIIHWN